MARAARRLPDRWREPEKPLLHAVVRERLEPFLAGARERSPINLVGGFLCAREAPRRMVAQRGGVILNPTSIHERIARSGCSACTAAKAGDEDA